MAKSKIKWEQIDPSSCVKERGVYKAIISGMKATIINTHAHWLLNCRELSIDDMQLEKTLPKVMKDAESIIKQKLKEQIKYYTQVLSKLK